MFNIKSSQLTATIVVQEAIDTSFSISYTADIEATDGEHDMKVQFMHYEAGVVRVWWTRRM